MTDNSCMLNGIDFNSSGEGDNVLAFSSHLVVFKLPKAIAHCLFQKGSEITSNFITFSDTY